MTSNAAIHYDNSTYITRDDDILSSSSHSDLPSCSSPPLVSERPSSQRKAHIYIQHPQLRDLIHPTEQRGVVYTVQANAVVRYDLRRPNQSPKTVTRLNFNPTTIAYSASHNLLAVGGPKANLILVQLPLVDTSSRLKSTETSLRDIRHIRIPHPGSSIVNSVSFADLPSSSRAVQETRLLVASNEQTVRIYRISPPNERKDASPSQAGSGSKSIRILQETVVQYNTCVNHASVSPDGQTLLSVGDEPEAYLHSLSSLSPPVPLHSTGPSSLRSNSSTPYGLIYSTSDFGYSPSEIRFSIGISKHTTMRVPRPIITIPTALCKDGLFSRAKELVSCAPRSLNTQALFSTAWSGDGWKFATGSQDGIVQVWDVRNLRRRLQHFRTVEHDGRKPLNLRQGEVDGAHPCMGKTWGVRTLRFNPSTTLGGRELLLFSEHESQLNVVDARTFDPLTRQVIHLPSVLRRNPLVQNRPKRQGITSVFYKPLNGEAREGRKRKRSAPDESSPAHLSPTRRLPERERPDEISHSPIQQYTIPALREVLARAFDLQNDMDQSIAISLPADGSSEALQDILSLPSEHSVQHQIENGLPSSAAPEASDATGSRAVADATVEREVADILEASGQIAQRLRGVNSQLEQMASLHESPLVSSSVGVTSSIRPQLAPFAARRIESNQLRATRREGILGRLQQRDSGSPNISTSRNAGSSLSRTRERVDELRRARDALAAMVDQHAIFNPDVTAPTVLMSEENDVSDEDLIQLRSIEPSFSRDLTRGVMRRWSRPGTVSPLNEHMTTSSNDATTQTDEGPSDRVEQDGAANENTDEENDAFWASIGMELDAQSAADMGFDEPSSLPRARMLINPALATAGSSDSEVDGPESRPESAQQTTNGFELSVGRTIPSVFRREGTASNLTPIQRRLRARQLQAIHARMASQESAADVSLVAHARTQTVPPLRSTSFYQHSNESMDELQEMTNDRNSPEESTEARPLFTASPEPGPSTLPADRNSRPFPMRSISSFLNEISARRTRFATSMNSTRPFSSRIFGNTSFYGMPFDSQHGEGEEDIIDGEDVVMDDDDTPLDIAGFGFGLPGTESQGYLYAGTMAKGGRGGRLIEFDLARGVAVKRNEKESSDEDEEDESEDEDAWNGKRGGWVGRRYAQGSWV